MIWLSIENKIIFIEGISEEFGISFTQVRHLEPIIMP